MCFCAEIEVSICIRIGLWNRVAKEFTSQDARVCSVGFFSYVLSVNSPQVEAMLTYFVENGVLHEESASLSAMA